MDLLKDIFLNTILLQNINICIIWISFANCSSDANPHRFVADDEYTNTAEGAFSSIEYIMRDVDYGVLIRYMHAGGVWHFLP